MFAIRSLLRSPTFLATALLSIGLSVGTGATAFGVIDAVRFRALPFKNGDRLVLLQEVAVAEGAKPAPASQCRIACDMQYVTYDAMRPLTFHTLDAVAAFTSGSKTMAKPGNFIYRAVTDSKISQRIAVEGALAGAMIVDTAGLSHPPRDRVMVIMQVPDSTVAADLEAGKTLAQTHGWYTFTINGRAWPNTDHINATVGDTLRWRVINASFDTHPMHLHGVYYHVDEFTGLSAERGGQSAAPGAVITQALTSFSGMSMTWVAEREGNWPFHCHFAAHIAPDYQATLVGERAAQPEMAGHENHAMTGMVGLIMGITVTPKKGTVAARETAPARKLRLLAVSDSGFPAMRPSLRASSSRACR